MEDTLLVSIRLLCRTTTVSQARPTRTLLLVVLLLSPLRRVRRTLLLLLESLRRQHHPMLLPLQQFLPRLRLLMLHLRLGMDMVLQDMELLLDPQLGPLEVPVNQLPSLLLLLPPLLLLLLLLLVLLLLVLRESLHETPTLLLEALLLEVPLLQWLLLLWRTPPTCPPSEWFRVLKTPRLGLGTRSLRILARRAQCLTRLSESASFPSSDGATPRRLRV